MALPALGLNLRGAAAQSADWQKTWDETVAAAETEGQVIVCMSPGTARRDFLLNQWKADYPKIDLSLSTVSGSSFVPRVMTERAAGRYLWDVFNSGPATGYTAIRGGLLDPLAPELILPEVKDPAVWGGWDNAFYDTEKKYVLALVADLLAPYYDAKRIPPAEAKSLGLRLLLQPAYKGKIVWYDPRIEGAGATFLVRSSTKSWATTACTRRSPTSNRSSSAT